MPAGKHVFWRSIQPLIGTAIGVGIFGLPYVFAQAGFSIGFFWLIFLAFLVITILIAYSEVIMVTDGHARLPGIIKRYLGQHWAWLATVVIFFSIWGAMVAYIIVGGEFLRALASPFFGGEVMVYQIVFYFFCSILIIGGLSLVSRIEVGFVFTLLLLMFFLLLGSSIYVEPENLSVINFENWFLPFGVIIFALSSMSALPEMSQILGRKKKLLSRSVILGYLIVIAVYIAFTTIIMAVTGPNTSEEAIAGLGSVVGPWALILGSIIGLLAVFNCFLVLGLSLMDTVIYDYKQRYLTGWAMAIIVPLLIFFIGSRDFISVMGFTGGIFSGFLYILIIATYLKAKSDPLIPKREWLVPNWLLMLCVGILVFGIIFTFIT